MVYKIDQRVIKLEEYGKENFKKELIRIGNQNNIYDQRNADWFESLAKNFEKYEEWFFLFDKDEPVAFSTVQKYYEGCYRVLTRMYIYRKYRRFTSPKDESIISPTMHLVPHQLEHIKGYKTAMVSLQDMRRREALNRFRHKMERGSHSEWHLHPNMMLTCDKDYGEKCWQSIIYTGEEPTLPQMTMNMWEEKYGK